MLRREDLLTARRLVMPVFYHRMRSWNLAPQYSLDNMYITARTKVD